MNTTTLQQLKAGNKWRETQAEERVVNALIMTQHNTLEGLRTISPPLFTGFTRDSVTSGGRGWERQAGGAYRSQVTGQIYTLTASVSKERGHLPVEMAQGRHLLDGSPRPRRKERTHNWLIFEHTLSKGVSS